VHFLAEINLLKLTSNCNKGNKCKKKSGQKGDNDQAVNGGEGQVMGIHFEMFARGGN